MRSSFLWVLVSAMLLLTGCSPSAAARAGTAPAASASGEASIGAEILADDPSLSHEDADGKTPEDVLLALIAARNASDWETAYSLFATPEADFETAAGEWAAAREHYDGFTVHEVRVIDRTNAAVRVTYATTLTAEPGTEPYEVVVRPPGEWWWMRKVAGRWRVQWLPRQ